MVLNNFNMNGVAIFKCYTKLYFILKTLIDLKFEKFLSN